MPCTLGFSGTVGLNRFCIGKDGNTAFQRYNGTIYNGDGTSVALFECVLFKVPSPEEAKLDDRFRLGVWVGKTARRRRPLDFRWRMNSRSAGQ